MNRLACLGALLPLTLLGGHAAAELTPWSVRAGIAHVAPQSSASNTDAGSIQVGDGSNLSLNLRYAFTPKWSIDVLGALPFEHDIRVGGDEVASTKHLPPTVSGLYHFGVPGALDLYVGGGINYTFFMDEQVDGADLSLEDSIGLAGMVGMTYALGHVWSFGADLRYISIETDAAVNGGDIGTVEINPWVFSATMGYHF
ncbi:MAG: OmpW family outer membrane protein [Oceanococcaceae bacterium]